MKKILLLAIVMLTVFTALFALSYHNFTVIAKCRFCGKKQTITVTHVLDGDNDDAETQATEIFDNHSSDCPAPYSGSIDIINSWQND